MSIKGIGTDIVAIERVAKLWQDFGDKFARRILSEDEIKIMQNLSEPVPYLAKRFAAKEAITKALGTGIGKNVSFHDISVLNDESGKPEIHFSHKSNAFIVQLGITHTHISLSDEKDFALAFVIVE